MIIESSRNLLLISDIQWASGYERPDYAKAGCGFYIRELGADFLGLGRRLELAAPWRCRGLGERLGEKLPELALRLRVQAELLHSNDIS